MATTILILFLMVFYSTFALIDYWLSDNNNNRED